MSLPDYYALLDVSTQATTEEIKRAYRRLVRLYHPDLNQEVETRQIKLVNEAYAVLSNPTSRAAYDIRRLEERRQAILLDVLILQRRKELHEQQMTWRQGVAGFVQEFKKGLHGES